MHTYERYTRQILGKKMNKYAKELYPTKLLQSVLIREMLFISSLILSSCVVNSPEPYQGDVAVKDTPLESIFDPDQGSYRKAPAPEYKETNSKTRAQRQTEVINSDNPEKYDYYYLHSLEKTELKRKNLTP